MIRHLTLLLLLPLTLSAADWPGWRGPQRDGTSSETGLLKSWPKEGPKLVWTAKGLGGGYSTPSVANGSLFVLGSQKDREFLRKLDLKDGKILWSFEIGAVGENLGPPYPGPRCTPMVEGDRVYALGSDGDLVCVEASSGKLVWKRPIEKDYDGNRGIWAYCESPLLDGDRLICTPGGEKATVLALDKKTGKEIWKGVVEEGGNQAGYASPIVAEVDGFKQYIHFLGSGMIGIDAKDGKFLWRYTKNVGGVSATTPLLHDGHLFSSASGTTGAGGDALLKLTTEQGKPGVKQVYLERSIVNFHGGVVRLGEHLYGTGRTGLVCTEWKTGKRVWFDRCVGHGSIIAADGHLYVRNDRGETALVEATPEGYREKGRFTQPSRSRFPTFCHPALANGHLYLRDEDGLFCYDVKAK